MITITIVVKEKDYERKTIDKIAKNTLKVLKVIGSEIIEATVNHNGLIVNIADDETT